MSSDEGSPGSSPQQEQLLDDEDEELNVADQDDDLDDLADDEEEEHQGDGANDDGEGDQDAENGGATADDDLEDDEEQTPQSPGLEDEIEDEDVDVEVEEDPDEEYHSPKAKPKRRLVKKGAGSDGEDGGSKKKKKRRRDSEEGPTKKARKDKEGRESKRPKSGDGKGSSKRPARGGKADKGDGERTKEKHGEKEMWDHVLKDVDSENDEEGERTRDDDAFIDDDGVERGEEREDSGDDRSMGDAPQAEEGEEEEELDEVTRLLKAGKKKKKADRAPEETAMLVEQFFAKLEVAFDTDMELFQRGQPCVKKLEVLPEFVSVLQKKHLQEELIAHGVLSIIKNWLELLPDGSLPNLTLRTMLLEAINELPISLENPEHRALLRKCGLGKAIMFLSRLEEETVKNRKMAKEIVDKWSRPIVRKSTRYEDMSRMEQEAPPNRPRIHRPKDPDEEELVDDGDDFDGGSRRREPRPGEPGYRYMPRIPQPVPLDFVIRPQSKLSEEQLVRANRGKVVDERKKKMTKTFQRLSALAKKKNVRAEKVSVEGRGMTKYI